MAHGLEVATGSSLGNDSVYGAPTEWVWSRDGVGIAAVYDSKGYPKGPDMFFAVGWQVTIPTDPSSTGLPDSGRIVRLWVDSPRYEDNPQLNDLKGELVTALMNSKLREVMQAKGYGCDESHLRRSNAQMQKTRTTTVFKVLTGEGHNWSSLEDAIRAVHADLGDAVNEVLRPFEKRLRQVF